MVQQYKLEITGDVPEEYKSLQPDENKIKKALTLFKKDLDFAQTTSSKPWIRITIKNQKIGRIIMKKLIKFIKKSFEISNLIQDSEKTEFLSKEPTKDALIAQEKLKKYSKKEQNKAQLTVFFSLISILLLLFSPTIFIAIFSPSSFSHQENKQETQSLQINEQDKSDKEKLEKEEHDKKEQEEKELAKKKVEEEKQKNIESCKNNGGQWLDYSNKCKTKAEIDEEKENYRKDCLTKSNYTWDGNSCIGKEWFWQGNDRSLNSDSKVSSNESKIVNEVFNAVERKSKSAYVLDSGDGKPWTVTIKMNGDSLSDYTVVFYIEGNGNVYRVIVKNGTIIE